MFTSHPSAELTRLLRKRPFQGAAAATFLFVGLDAKDSLGVPEGVEVLAHFRLMLDAVAAATTATAQLPHVWGRACKD